MWIAVWRAVAGACLVLLPTAIAGAGTLGIGGFEGTWVRDAHERDDAARDAEIVRVTEPMSFAFRGFARGVMRKRMVPIERYVVEQGGSAPQIRNDKGVVFPLDGRALVMGENREVTSRLSEGGEIEQSWKEGKESRGITTWRLDGDGRLVVSQRVFDAHFEGPIEYSTTYRRLEP